MPNWPRIYSTTIQQRQRMSPEELEELWLEYNAFWRGHEGHSNRTEQQDYQKDVDEDRDGRYR